MAVQPCPLPVLAGALVLDRVIGEPPLRVHPVMAIGAVADRVETHLLQPDDNDDWPILRGGAGWLIGLGVCTATGSLLARTPRLVQALALWTMFSHKMLIDEVGAVETALTESLEAGQDQVQRIVSRDAKQLDEPQVRMSAIESLAENLSDSVTAPLLFWALGGMPGVLAYRWMNTADARFGYRDRRWEYLGKVSALADDVANLLPARLTGLFLSTFPPVLTRLRRDATVTPSPNAGWPMGAMARALGVRLEKPGVYTLNPEGREPRLGDIGRAIKRVNRAHVGIALVTAAIAWTRWRK